MTQEQLDGRERCTGQVWGKGVECLAPSSSILPFPNQHVLTCLTLFGFYIVLVSGMQHSDSVIFTYD